MATANRFRSLRLPACALALAISGLAVAQDADDASVYTGGKVANFSLPQYDQRSPKFENLAFWVAQDGRTRIDYAYGSEGAEVKLESLGANPAGKGFAVRFPNGHVLDVVPDGEHLVVSDRRGTYRKTFEWMYEGPVDGRGTFCTPCVEEAGAMAFVREHFLE